MVFPELRPALFPAGGAVAGGLGLHPFTRQPGRAEASREEVVSVGKHPALLFSPLSQPGSSLEQTHIFVLAHILRRPIIVYGVKYYKSFRGETLGYTRFQGEPAVVATPPPSAGTSLRGNVLSA